MCSLRCSRRSSRRSTRRRRSATHGPTRTPNIGSGLTISGATSSAASSTAHECRSASPWSSPLSPSSLASSRASPLRLPEVGSINCAFAPRRSVVVNADADFRLRRTFGARHRPARAHHHDRHSQFDQGVSPGAVGRHEHRQLGVCRGGSSARRRVVVDRDAGGAAQRHSSANGRVRLAFLLHLPLYRRAELPRARRAAAQRRLGQHGRGTTAT